MNDLLEFCNLHLPNDVRVFSVPVRGVRRQDDDAFVYDVPTCQGILLRHYAFPRKWFEVTCSFDRNRRLVEEDGTIAWAFNCDICTPLLRDGGNAFNVDLDLDVLVAADGRRFTIKDEADFLQAVRNRWIGREEAHGALSGLAELERLIECGSLLAFLELACPLDTFPDSEGMTVQPPPRRLTLDQVPRLRCSGSRSVTEMGRVLVGMGVLPG